MDVALEEKTSLPYRQQEFLLGLCRGIIRSLDDFAEKLLCFVEYAVSTFK